jgi:hypothetical protein
MLYGINHKKAIQSDALQARNEVVATEIWIHKSTSVLAILNSEFYQKASPVIQCVKLYNQLINLPPGQRAWIGLRCVRWRFWHN